MPASRLTIAVPMPPVPPVTSATRCAMFALLSVVDRSCNAHAWKVSPRCTRMELFATELLDMDVGLGSFTRPRAPPKFSGAAMPLDQRQPKRCASICVACGLAAPHAGCRAARARYASPVPDRADRRPPRLRTWRACGRAHRPRPADADRPARASPTSAAERSAGAWNRAGPRRARLRDCLRGVVHRASQLIGERPVRALHHEIAVERKGPTLQALQTVFEGDHRIVHAHAPRWLAR